MQQQKDGIVWERRQEATLGLADWCAVFVPEQAQRKGACGPLQGPRTRIVPRNRDRPQWAAAAAFGAGLTGVDWILVDSGGGDVVGCAKRAITRARAETAVLALMHPVVCGMALRGVGSRWPAAGVAATREQA